MQPKVTLKSSQKPKIKAHLKVSQIFWLIFCAIVISAWVGLVVYLVQLLLAQLLVAIFGLETMIQTLPNAIYSALSYIIAFAIIWCGTPQLRALFKTFIKSAKFNTSDDRPMNRTELGLKGLPTWTDIGLAPVGLIITFILSAFATWLMSFFSWFDAEEVQELSFGDYLFGADRVIAFIVLVFVAPIAEELIFRGWLYGKLREHFASRIPEKVGIFISIILVSLVFALMHGQWNVGVTVFVMSVIMCLMREITGTIYSGILLHMLKNGVAFYLIYLLGMGLSM